MKEKRRLIFVLVLSIVSILVNAESSIKIDGIYYVLNNSSLSAEVSKMPSSFDGTSIVSNYYSGDIIIPEVIEYEGKKDVSLILPIRKNNKELDYRFTIRFSLYDESEVDSLNSLREKMYTLSKQIKKGFTREQVEEILGKPICEGSLPKGGGGSIALRFMPLTTKRGDLCLEYSFLKIYLRDGKVHHIEKVVRFC